VIDACVVDARDHVVNAQKETLQNVEACWHASNLDVQVGHTVIAELVVEERDLIEERNRLLNA
jgi:hypothetical protein